MSIPACLLGAGFLASSIYTSMAKMTSPVMAQFRESLTDEQKAIHDGIKAERRSLYVTGIILGAILATGYLYYFAPSGQTNKACYFIVLMMTITHFYYLLMPKSTYMVYHLKSQDQAYLWNQVHKEYQKRHVMGFLVGMVGYALITWGSAQFSFPRPNEIWSEFF